MKLIYLLIGLVFVATFIFVLISRKSRQTAPPTSENIEVNEPAENPYQDMRNLALTVTPEQLELTIPPDETKVFGVVMDWSLSGAVATFASFETGDASMYLSSGGIMIGGIGHENVVSAAKAFVTKAQLYLDEAEKVDTTPLPDKDCVRFYFLTNKGRFSAQENIRNFENESSKWLPLFEEGNKVITELRNVD